LHSNLSTGFFKHLLDRIWNIRNKDSGKPPPQSSSCSTMKKGSGNWACSRVEKRSLCRS